MFPKEKQRTTGGHFSVTDPTLRNLLPVATFRFGLSTLAILLAGSLLTSTLLDMDCRAS